MQKRVAVIGAGEFQEPLVAKAKSLGHLVYCFAWSDGAEAKDTCDEFFDISITDISAIKEICSRLKPDAVVSVGSDLAVRAVNAIAEEFTLPGNAQATTLKTTNKFEMRKTLQRAGLKTAFFTRIAQDDDIAIDLIEFPCIIKPTDRSGSRAVYLLDTRDDKQFIDAVHESQQVSLEGAAIVEGFLVGEEFSIETISQSGIHRILAVTKKYTTGEPHYIEVAHIQSPDLNSRIIPIVEKTVYEALNALGITDGAAHIELMVDNDEVSIIEIGARGGGDYIASDLVELSTGYDYLESIIKVALGEPLPLEGESSKVAAGVRFFFDEDDIQLLQSAITNHSDSIVKFKIRDTNAAVIDSSSRHGYFIAKADSGSELVGLFGIGR